MEDLQSEKLLQDMFDELTLFKIGGTPILKINEQQRDFLNTIFRKMIEEQKSDYAYKDDLIRNNINLIMHEALKLQPSEHYDQHKNCRCTSYICFSRTIGTAVPR